MKKVTVSAAALRKVLNALNGPGYYIRELQVTRGPLIGGDNPINILCDEYNAAVEAHNEARKVGKGTVFEDRNMNVTREMPKYKCHKEVWALKIAGIVGDQHGVRWTAGLERR